MIRTTNPFLVKLPEYSFLLFFAVLPFLDIFAPIALAIVLLFGLLFSTKSSFFKHFAKNPGSLFLTVFFVLALISLLYSTQLDESQKKIGKLVVFFLIPIAFLLVNPSAKLLLRAQKIFIGSLILFCIISLISLGYNYIANYEISHWYNFVQTSMYHKYMPEDAMYLNTGLVLVLFGNFNKNVKVFVAFLFLTVIVLFGVRLGLLVFGLIISVYFLMNYKSFLTLRSLLIFLVGLALAFIFVQQSRYARDKLFDTLEKIGITTGDQVSEIGEEYHNISLREKMWSSSLYLVQKRPLIGYGAGTEKSELTSVYKERGYNMDKSFNAHSQYLSVMLQYGMFGLLWLGAVFLFFIYKSIQSKDIIALLITLVMALSMVTESYLELQQGIFYFCSFIMFLSFRLKLKKELLAI
ncbi:O-antigen ligase family protein [Luteirhabdus pelagi]|uniref:O-antigen ligase family protein n=1 Tax=Luteirhabdus pelagi TaxID=2792783 RepID=UPI00193A82A9|nr:O-antigen ligase family protein [Luteirhabdus pelagi]